MVALRGVWCGRIGMLYRPSRENGKIIGLVELMGGATCLKKALP